LLFLPTIPYHEEFITNGLLLWVHYALDELHYPPDQVPCQDYRNPDPVWADSCSGYAYALEDCPAGTYSVFAVDANNRMTTLVANKTTQYATFYLDKLYYMQTAGYVLVSMQGFSGSHGHQIAEIINLSGSCKTIGLGELSRYEVIPSPDGSKLCEFTSNMTSSSNPSVHIAILDADSLDTIYTYQVDAHSKTWYWQSDSCFVIASTENYSDWIFWYLENGQITKDSSNTLQCTHLKTSSDPYCPATRTWLSIDFETNAISIKPDSGNYCAPR
jgi:hypothetical protein